MSFSGEVKKELLSLNIKMNCCRKAFLLGALYNSSELEKGFMKAEFNFSETAYLVSELLGDNSACKLSASARGGHKIYTLEFYSKSVASFLSKVIYGQAIRDAAKFRCDECRRCFMRGILASSATVNDPSKGYHLEISLPKRSGVKLSALTSFFEECGFSPKKLERNKSISLYFKSNTVISDVLNYAGAMKSSFAVTNTYIERDFRNDENRATNCVARNISKSVGATQKQIAAINKLIDAHKLDALPNELIQTATLRIENDDVSLSELALLHEPPISKSGLNHRLEKICKAADEL
ncbi:MAG: DNA-binding protein WhiA [Clostridia bacterium]|nr:DNA-binding protein WhiA [Clostridia bacterium]